MKSKLKSYIEDLKVQQGFLEDALKGLEEEPPLDSGDYSELDHVTGKKELLEEVLIHLIKIVEEDEYSMIKQRAY